MDNKKRKLIFLAVLLVSCIATGVVAKVGEKHQPTQPIPAVVQQVATKKESKLMQIYVSGAVVQPGLYELPAGARALQAVDAGGGLREDADADRVNLARKLKDGSQVNVPVRKQVREQGKTGTSKRSSSNDVRNTSNSKVNINTATAAELDALPGIGPALAQRIVTRRNLQRFNMIEELMAVQGIGKSKYEKLKEYVCVE